MAAFQFSITSDLYSNLIYSKLTLSLTVVRKSNRNRKPTRICKLKLGSVKCSCT